jgi:phosphoribosyl 1,2-cyclic phosphodiesterase
VRVWLLSSGSSGNLAIVEAEGRRLMIDAGVSPRGAVARMSALGADLFPKGVSALVVTHHHGDHMGKVEPLARALRAPLYMHRGIQADVVRRRLPVREYRPGETLRVGPFEVDALPVPHDAPQVAVAVRGGGFRFAIVTDLGHVPPGLDAMLADCDGALVEANHCRELLAIGPYPPRLRDRVAGNEGHLSNGQTAELAARLVGTRLARLYLGHISRANNTVERALETVRGRARGLDVQAVPNGVPCLVDVARRPTQLSFGFSAGVFNPPAAQATQSTDGPR